MTLYKLSGAAGANNGFPRDSCYDSQAEAPFAGARNLEVCMKSAIILFTALLLSSCFTGTDDPEPIRVSVHGRLNTLCPEGVVCDENWIYHAYAGDIDSVYLNVFFAPGIVKDNSPANMMKGFDYLYFTFSFPSLGTDSSTVFLTSPAMRGAVSDSGAFRNEVLKFENGMMFGRFSFRTRFLTESIQSRTKKCIVDSIAGPCYRDRELVNEIRYDVDYAVELAD